MLRIQDLKEMIEEEDVYVNEFDTFNMNKKNIDRAEAIYQDRMAALSEGHEEIGMTLIGEPYYQPHKNFEQWLYFNSSTAKEEKNMKLLLNLPIIPQKQHANIDLVYPHQKYYVKQKIQLQ